MNRAEPLITWAVLLMVTLRLTVKCAHAHSNIECSILIIVEGLIRIISCKVYKLGIEVIYNTHFQPIKFQYL